MKYYKRDGFVYDGNIPLNDGLYPVCYYRVYSDNKFDYYIPSPLKNEFYNKWVKRYNNDLNFEEVRNAHRRFGVNIVEITEDEMFLEVI